MKNKPTIGVLLGDPTGIGPEIVVKLLLRELHDSARIVIIGDRRIFQMGLKVVGTELSFPVIHALRDLPPDEGKPVILDFPAIAPEEVTYKQVCARAGRAVYKTLEYAIELSLNGGIDGFTFAPLHKEAMGLGGCPYPSESELFKDRFKCPGVHGEINILDEIWTTRVTSHVPLKEVGPLITRQRIYETVRLLNDELERFGIEKPRIAVAALNPHAGEGGRCGTEETTEIAPAVHQARAEGMAVEGPFPADTLFLRVQKENFRGVVSMYHDQGQIATKLLGFEKGVTLHGGMPVPITTPAHGTAFGKAGEGRANPEAMIRAFRIACQLAGKKIARESEAVKVSG